MAAQGTGSIATTVGQGGQEFVTVKHSSGAELDVYLHGATVTRLTNAKGVNFIFLSEKAVFDGAKGIRGGIPLVWPQFGPNGPLQQHGFARNRQWTVTGLTANATPEAPATVELTLKGTETAEEWCGDFTLVYTVSVWDDRLGGELRVTNNAAEGGAAFWNHALHHTYYTTPDITKVEVAGLQGLQYFDKVAGGAEAKEADAVVRFTENVDRVYVDSPLDTPVTVTHLGVGGGGDGAYTATVAASGGFAQSSTGTVSAPTAVDCVVWNPWVQWCKEKSDIGDEDYKTFLCVEPGRVSDRVTVPAGATWVLTQDITWTK